MASSDFTNESKGGTMKMYYMKKPSSTTCMTPIENVHSEIAELLKSQELSGTTTLKYLDGYLGVQTDHLYSRPRLISYRI